MNVQHVCRPCKEFYLTHAGSLGGIVKHSVFIVWIVSRLPPHVCLRDVILCHALYVSQSDFTGNEFILEGANP